MCGVETADEARTVTKTDLEGDSRNRGVDGDDRFGGGRCDSPR